MSSCVCLRSESLKPEVLSYVGARSLGSSLCRECVCVLARSIGGENMYVCPGRVSEFVFSVAEMWCFFFSFFVCVCVCSHHHNSLVQCGSVGRGSQRLGCGNSDTHRRSDVLTFLPNKFPPPSLIIPRVRAGSWRHIGQGQNN